MDFFEQQDKARKKTLQLVLLFAVGVIATVIAVNLACFLLYAAINAYSAQTPGSMPSYWQAWWSSNLNWQISGSVVAAVVIGTLFRFFELAGGGKRVAEWAGAKLIDLNTSDQALRQYINVSEEMAIAAGMPVPELYVMERETAINAFVAGYRIDQAVMVVTKGALDTLSRDELQGVIGHEYSHILNADMRLNVRLMAFLAGLVMIGQIGRFLLHSNLHWRSSRRDSRAGALIMIGGLLLVVVGYVGVLIGRMIKAAVSRQREYLADASSVQFTRNPDGISGALYKIANGGSGSQLNHRHAEDMSHFCFGETVALSQRLATHPPISERIRRINPNFIPRQRAQERKEVSPGEGVSSTQPSAFNTAVLAAGVTSMVGQVTPDHVQYASSLYKHIPEKVRNWVHQSEGARAFLYSQVMLASPRQQQQMLDLIKLEDRGVIETMQEIWPWARRLDDQLRLPILEMLVPTLKRMTHADRHLLTDRLQRLAQLDGELNFTEWLLLTLLSVRLKKPARIERPLSNKVQDFSTEVITVLRAFVHISSVPTLAEQQVVMTCNQFSIEGFDNPELRHQDYQALSEALATLENISFMWRKLILQGCADVVQSDGELGQQEYEALRLVAECMEAPMPPMTLTPSERDARDEPIPFTTNS